VHKWSSEEDQTYFKKLWNESKVTVLGSSTFDFDPIKPSPATRLIVLTSHPETYAERAVPGQVEFSSEAPRIIVDRLREDGYEQLIVAGGAHIATSFFADGLINELWLTLEPKIFGSGRNFVAESQLDIELELISCERINERGTILTKYRVLH
jgi:dihydrofolate reductase